MTVPNRSQLARLTDPDAFWWATGIEDTFITEPWPATGRTLDEYELTDHYNRWSDDIALMSELGVKTARYGIPWHRIQPEPHVWNWQFADQTLERLLAVGIEPLVDLVHYGLPRWIENAYLHPDYPRFVADYASRVAERFRGRVFWYTPLNEPRITAWYCGRLGWWPPFRRGWQGFVVLMLAICRGIIETVKALQQVDPAIVPYHVDATDLFRSDDPDLADEVKFRQQLVFLALDLISGRVDVTHPLWSWLLNNGAREADLEYFLAQRLDLPVIGINLYPMYTLKRLLRAPDGRFRIRMPYASPDLITTLARLYHDRYRVPLMISETASTGSLRRRLAWLDGSVTAVKQARGEGIPVVGYTWWPMFALIAWAYRQSNRPVTKYLLQMGLWDLDDHPDTALRRLRTPLIEAYQSYTARGSEAVGQLVRPSASVAG